MAGTAFPSTNRVQEMIWNRYLYVFLISMFLHEVSSLRDDSKENMCEKNMTHHCQFDKDTGFTIQFCAFPVLCSSGTHAVLDNVTMSVTCEECAEDMFQPKDKWSHILCNEQQFVCDNSTTTQNNKCACNYTAGYKLNSTSVCNQTCFSQESFCECVKADCKEGEILTKEYDCVQCPPNRDGNMETGSKTAGVAVGFAILAGVFIVGCLVMYVCKSRKSCCKKKEDAVAVPVIRITDIEKVELQTRGPVLHSEYYD